MKIFLKKYSQKLAHYKIVQYLCFIKQSKPPATGTKTVTMTNEITTTVEKVRQHGLVLPNYIDNSEIINVKWDSGTLLLQTANYKKEYIRFGYALTSTLFFLKLDVETDHVNFEFTTSTIGIDAANLDKYAVTFRMVSPPYPKFLTTNPEFFGQFLRIKF